MQCVIGRVMNDEQLLLAYKLLFLKACLGVIGCKKIKDVEDILMFKYLSWPPF